MNATEFKTTIKGSTIEIPDYESFKNKQVRVIILEAKNQNEVSDSKDIIDQLVSRPRHISSEIKLFSRDEANER